MGFGNPLILWALLALAIPIIIHLFNFRRYKKIFFSNIAFLQKAKEEGKRKRKLKEYLILASRLLAFTCLIFAFAAPFFNKAKPKSIQELLTIIAIDNSLSMQSRGKQGILLESAKNKAFALLESIKNQSNILVIANNQTQKRFGSYSKAKKFIQELKPQSVPFNYSTIIKKSSHFFKSKTEEDKRLFIISDMQKNGFIKANKRNLDSNIKVNLIPLETLESVNLTIDSAWFDSPIIKEGNEIGLQIRSSNFSENNIENIDISLTGINNNTNGILSVDIKAQSSTNSLLKFTPTKSGWNTYKLSINDDGEGFDDNYYLSVNVKPDINILILQNSIEISANNPLYKLYSSNSNFKVNLQNIQNPNYRDLKSYDLIAINQCRNISTGLSNTLNSYVKEGGKLCITLPENNKGQNNLTDYRNFGIDIRSWVDLNENIPIKNPNLSDPFFKNTYSSLSNKSIMPWVKGYWQLTAPEFRPLVKIQNNIPIFWSKKIGSGSMYFLSSSLKDETSNFSKNELFVISFLQPLFVGVNKSRLAYIIGENNNIKTYISKKDKEDNFIIEGEGSSFIPIPINNGEFVKTIPDMPIFNQGIYTLSLGNDSLTKIAFNYNRLESNLNFLKSVDLLEFAKSIDAEVLNKSIDELKMEFQSQYSKSKLWLWFVLLAIVFILIEIILLKTK